MKKYFLVFIFLISAAIFAQKTDQIQSSCKDEKTKFCSQITNSKIRDIQCLLENESNLSENCKKAIKSSIEEIQKSGNGECKEDVKKHCSWTIPGGGRIIKCLLKNEKNLSEQCSKKLNNI